MTAIIIKVIANLALLFVEWALKKGYLHENTMVDARRNPQLRNALRARIERLYSQSIHLRTQRGAGAPPGDDQAGPGVGFRAGR